MGEGVCMISFILYFALGVFAGVLLTIAVINADDQ